MSTRLDQLVADAARRTPGHRAIVDPESTWTYQELDDCCGRLASRLSTLGVRQGDRVAVWAPKSNRVVAAFQAVLRLGAAYVPIDPQMPTARAMKILDDCDVRLTVTTEALGAFLDVGGPRFCLDAEDEWQTLPKVGIEAPGPGSEDDLAYILYTSGSTGTPKGVCISHRNALAFVEWAVSAVGITKAEVLSNHASFNFDLSVFDLYGAFLSGSTVCLVPEAVAYAARQCVEFLRLHRISVWYSVPSVLVMMIEHGSLLDRGMPSLDVVIFAGEPFPIRFVRILRETWPDARLFNFYGPTETNVCTSYEVCDIPSGQVAPVPIGVPASGDRVWLVNDNGTVGNDGEPGELYVDGPTVMLGYWGRGRHVGPYATGDICVRRADGNVEFCGRRDQMLKRRGHRIELGEIEATLIQHPNVSEVAIAAVGDGIDQRLVACVVPRLGPAPTLLDLKAFSARHLPRYMLIDQVHPLDALPRSANGKIDRRALLHHVSTTARG